MATPKKTPGFEKRLEKLEGIVTALEEGGLSLDDSLKQFEEGVKLARECEASLSQAEKRIEILMQNAEGELEAEPFDKEKPPAAKPKVKKTPPPKADEDLPPEPEEDADELLF